MADTLLEKLQTRNYTAINNHERKALHKAYKDAPFLFRKCKKRAGPVVDKLEATYCGEPSATLLKEKARAWGAEPTSFVGDHDYPLTYGMSADQFANVFELLLQLRGQDIFSERKKRIVRVALAALHQPRTSLNELWSRVEASQVSFRLDNQARQCATKDELRVALKYGRKWWRIAHICAKLRVRDTRADHSTDCKHAVDCSHGDCLVNDECYDKACSLEDECAFHEPKSIRNMIGVVLFLNNGWLWESANIDQCYTVLARIAVDNDLLTQALEYSGVVVTLLDWLRQGVQYSESSVSIYGNSSETQQMPREGNSSTSSGYHAWSQQLFIRTPVQYQYDAPIFVSVQSGDVESSKALLCSGTTSIDAVDPYGLGLSYYATYYCWRSHGRDSAVRMWSFLRDAGVDTTYLDEMGNTSLDTLIDNILVDNAKCGAVPGASVLDHLRPIFHGASQDIWDQYRDSRGLTTVHEILLGLESSYGTLKEYLETDLGRSSIDLPDALGRTPLSWAVEYCWTEAVDLLISFGADVRQPRKTLLGHFPLLHLAMAGPMTQDPKDLASVVRLVLQSGVDVNAVDEEGWTALHVAASWGLQEMVRELLDIGGRAGTSLYTRDGQSPGDIALDCGHLEVAMLLYDFYQP